VLRVEGLSASYGDVRALKDASFSVRAGQIVSIVGSNGAGKSTALNTLSGVIRCSGGRVEFLEQRTETLPAHEIVELGLVQIPEGRLLFPYMSVQENLELGSFVLRAREKSLATRERVFDLFPILRERRKQMAGTLSGGEQQMLAIGRGLMALPRLLMLDEPSLGLAPIIVAQVFEIVHEIRRQGITVLLVEQNVVHSLEISDWGYVLENGSIVLEGAGKELLDNPQVKEAYMGL
jgi:branched-chain amino acid transport system ATP-binding protein